jgi:hypothetical protein
MSQRYRVRPWREGDRPTCTWANRTRTHAPPCGPPVAVVTANYDYRDGTRTTTVCEYHRRAVYDGPKAAQQRASQRGKDIYRLGLDALLGNNP